MKKYNVLVITDHTSHTKDNSLYALVREMLQHKLTNKIDVLSRGNANNKNFFTGRNGSEFIVSAASAYFNFSAGGEWLKNDLKTVKPQEYDLVWLRLPPPLDLNFLRFIRACFPQQVIINEPGGIYQAGSKEFLTHFPELCPPMKICKSIEDITAFKEKFAIVLKPLRGYGGQGIIKIDNDDVWIGEEEMSFDDLITTISNNKIGYLGVKYLRNVIVGDKRIIVVNGKIIGASLRLPAKGSWLCNASMGGSSHKSEVTKEEKYIIEELDPVLSRLGIAMYGVDTLVGDDGTRVLSEINTTSIGGFMQMQNFGQSPVLENTIDQIWEYYLKNV